MSQSHTTSTGKPFRVRDLFALAVWFGLACGLLEGLFFLLLQASGWVAWTRRVSSVDANILWVSPVTDVFLFGLAAAALAPICWALRNRGWWTFAVGWFAALSFLALLSVPDRIRESGQLMLALGLATVMARQAGKNIAGSAQFFRRTMGILAGIVVLAFLGVRVGGAALETAQVARLPEAQKDAPNVLLIVLDTLRGDRLSAYGYGKPTTPFLDEFAGQSVQFDDAFANGSFTLTSHASIFTGLLPNQHSALRNPLADKYTTVAEILTAHGYSTAGVVANSQVCTKYFGLAQGFQHWENIFTGVLDSFVRTAYGRMYMKQLKRFVDYQGRMQDFSGAEATQRALRWLDHRPNRPFFLFLNYFDTHTPDLPPREFAERFSATPDKICPPRKLQLIWPGANKVDEAERMRLANEAYDASLAYLDSQLRVLWEGIQKRGLDKNLLVIITADHGESLGEHGLYEHGNSLYLEQIRIPLFIHFAGKTPAGMKVSGQAGLNELAQTILSFASISSPDVPGHSLEEYWNQAPVDRPPVISEVAGGRGYPGVLPTEPIAQGWLKSLSTSDWHFVLQENGKVELYRWRQDSRELRNMAGDAEYAQIVQHFRSLIQSTAQGTAGAKERAAQ